MLVLTRQAGDWVTITAGASAIKVKVVEVKGGQVKLGFTAPPDTTIRRAELPPRAEGAGGDGKKP